MKKTKKVLSALMSLALVAGCVTPVSAATVDLSKYDAAEKNFEKINEVIGKAKNTIDLYSGFNSENAEESYRNQLISEKDVSAIGRVKESDKWYDAIMSFRKNKNSLKEVSFASNDGRLTYVLMSEDDYNNLQNNPEEYKLEYINDVPYINYNGQYKSLSATPDDNADVLPVYVGDENVKALEDVFGSVAGELNQIDTFMTEDGYWNISDDKQEISPIENCNYIFNGKSGNDTYLIQNSKGIACVHDYSFKNPGDSDTVIFDYDTTDSKMSVYRDADDLYVIDETKEILVYIKNYFTDSRVEFIKISEDLTLEFNDVCVLTDVLNGTEKNDNLKGYVQTSLLLGNAGNDTITASEGENYWAFGDKGNDTISVPFGNALVFGGDDNDVINITKSGKTSFEFYNYGYNVVFAGEGKDTVSTLDSGDSENLIIGGSGDDTLKGGFSDDIYVYYHGDGNDTISESFNACSKGGTDYLFFADLTPEDIKVNKKTDWWGNPSFTIDIKDGSGTIKIPKPIESGFTYYEALEFIVFTDGTVWNFHDLMSF